jgi:hypothetical protein
MRVTFEIVALEDEKIFLYASDMDVAMFQYYMLLEICGWKISDYEQELLTRIDREWTIIHKKIVLIPKWLSN